MRIKKAVVLSLLTVFLMLFSTNDVQAKVMWGKTELKPGQIGKVTVLTDTTLFGLDAAGNLKVIRTAKAGEEYRVYRYRSIFGGLYGVGGGSYFKKDSTIKYETPSKVKLQALGVKLSKHTSEGSFQYPQVEGLISSDAQKKINLVLQQHIARSDQNAQELEELELLHREEYVKEHGHPVPAEQDFMYSYGYHVRYEVKYNENNILSILMYDDTYTGGAHGNSTVQSYNFDALTGNQITLTNVAKSSSALTKMKKYISADLLNQHKKTGMIFPELIDSITVDNQRPFYFYENGIVIKFQQYEIAPYAAGMPEVKIPYSVFR